MLISQLLNSIDYSVVCGDESSVNISGIEYDSRKASSGDLFVCLVGAKTDGHRYAEKAYNNGCRAFLCTRHISLPEDAFVAVTHDTRAALAVISAVFFGNPADKLCLIGITGTKGKTTTALLIHSILNNSGYPCGYIGSNGIFIGNSRRESANTTPESRELHGIFAEMCAEGITHAVLEVSSQALDRNRVDGIDFDICIFTNLGRDHISDVEHKNEEEYRAAKRKLFTSHGCKNALYNADDPAWEYMLDGTDCPSVSFSMKDPTADFYGTAPSIYRNDTSLGIRFECFNNGKETTVMMRTPGLFSAQNGLAAIAACALLGVKVEASAEILAVTPVDGRFEVVDSLPRRTFIVDYAHNGLSLTSALTVLREYDPARLICVFGSVGGRTQERRRELAEAASALADYVIVTSDNPDFEAPEAITDEIASHLEDVPFEVIVDREEAVRHAVRISRDGDIVLFAGKGHETYQLICGEKVPFVEREIIADECRILEAELRIES
ncbi:MAG: UDP-N-acetylmuramoyl-L-alanyl-D-glutamate--2,6-diaminopimelate ligase [Clostridia bacterium]|nr:UDP-N-acetylmuramoyl-L-alanyl-D-glutamate--2,6-diaminopimelate ligase [Clostridia bacterium]